MPSFGKLSDAAIAIEQALAPQGVDFGIFGGYAVAVLGGPRESKDIDCAIGCTKEWLVENLGRVPGFRSTGNARADLASFLYGNDNILIEFFPTSLSMMRTMRVEVTGQQTGKKTTVILHPVFLYKGKLQAAATRAKHSDSVDLLFLEGKHLAELAARNHELNKRHVGMALKRYPHLLHSFQRLGINIADCTALAQDIDIEEIAAQRPAANAVQNGLLWNTRTPEGASR
ncbi:hypothetical protein AC578_4972 [Pseudocercospora eumusae]|uniref:Uncharacterized protein n=1 Tax=Pseudocercospora eumusae TaxID=321146 RepID=A0A139GTN1_9PEZI|nr:hypothetical protein AC578_4972 [Pseudocercospora eumusae]